MPSTWDEEEKRNDREQSEYFPDLKRSAKTESQTLPQPTHDMAYPPAWQRWGLPAGLTLGILIGLAVGYVIMFVHVLG